MDPLTAIASTVSTPNLKQQDVRPVETQGSSETDFKNILGKTNATDSDVQKLNYQEAATIEEYTSIVTSQYLTPLMKEMSFSMGEDNYAMQHYHSMFIDILSKELTQNDSLGLKSIIESKITK